MTCPHLLPLLFLRGGPSTELRSWGVCVGDGEAALGTGQICKRQTNTGLTAPADIDGLDPGRLSAGREFSSSATRLIGISAKPGREGRVGTGQIVEVSDCRA